MKLWILKDSFEIKMIIKLFLQLLFGPFNDDFQFFSFSIQIFSRTIHVPVPYVWEYCVIQVDEKLVKIQNFFSHIFSIKSKPNRILKEKFEMSCVQTFHILRTIHLDQIIEQ